MGTPLTPTKPWRPPVPSTSSCVSHSLPTALFSLHLSLLVTPHSSPRDTPTVTLVSQVLLRELLIASEDKMPAMAGPEFVYIIAALAKLKAEPDSAWLNRWMAVSRHRCAVVGVWVCGSNVLVVK